MSTRRRENTESGSMFDAVGVSLRRCGLAAIVAGALVAGMNAGAVGGTVAWGGQQDTGARAVAPGPIKQEVGRFSITVEAARIGAASAPVTLSYAIGEGTPKFIKVVPGATWLSPEMPAGVRVIVREVSPREAAQVESGGVGIIGAQSSEVRTGGVRLTIAPGGRAKVTVTGQVGTRVMAVSG